MATHEEENTQVLSLLQALLGAVSSNFRAVSISCQDRIVVTIVLSEESTEDREEIDDIEFELLALQSYPVLVSTEVVISSRPIEEICLPGRLVFLRREHASVHRAIEAPQRTS